MKKQYQGETVLSCDTITVPFGDTAILMDGASFSWNKRLENRNRVLIVRGTILGMGENGFAGSTDLGSPRARWDGIVLDSCAKADFTTLSIRNAFYAVQLGSKDVHIGAGVFFETGGIRLPDSSVLREEYMKDTVIDFRSEELLTVSRKNYKCPDQPKRVLTESDSWDWRDKLYWSGVGVLMGVGIWIWTINITEHKI